MAEWVLDVERAYVAAATKRTIVDESAADQTARAKALAAIGAVASHYLAVGTPRSLGLVVDTQTLGAGVLSLEAHRTWFSPTDVRCHYVVEPEGVRLIEGTRATTLAEALACDIVCVHTKLFLDSRAFRRGTHINVLAANVIVGDELEKIADITREVPGLGQLAAGFVDGRQLDEITLFLAGNATIAIAALG
ncbi:MAG: hypothetical protein ACKV2T_32285 [Kofleriaceae bacterium]